MLTALLVAAASAYAQPQGSVTATGVLAGPVEDGDLDPTPKYKMADEETGTNYVLVSGFVELAPFVGQRVTIAGEPIGGADWAPPALNVTQIEPADGGDDNDPPAVNDKATLAFELTVDGDPPADAAFYGNVRTGEGGPGLYVPLTDPDKDRVYTGSTTVDRFGPGPRPVPPGTEPVSLPVQIVQESDGNIEVIRDFGVVPLTGDRTFRANFEDGTGTTPAPRLGVGSGVPTDPASGVDVNEDGLIDENDGRAAAAISDAAMEAARSSGERSLPATGGLPLTLGAALLLAAGLLVHRALRALR